MNTIQVSLSVFAETPDALTRAMECIGRAATGLALEDIDAEISVGSIGDGDDD